MNIFVSLLLFISFETLACSFTQKAMKVISLSGPVTVLLRETGLLRDPHLKGISIFNPVNEKEYSGKVYPGGLFIAQSIVPEFRDSVLFYDEGKQLEMLLKRESTIKGIAINTRSLHPLQVSDLIIKKITPFVADCSGEFKKFTQKGKELQNALIKEIGQGQKVIFYLGEISQTRYPQLVIANDGVVKLLRDKKLIETYPSDLAYVNWSAKIRSELAKQTLHVGLVDPGMKFEQKFSRSSLGMTLTYPGALTPGHSQLEAFLYWAKQK